MKFIFGMQINTEFFCMCVDGDVQSTQNNKFAITGLDEHAPTVH